MHLEKIKSPADLRSLPADALEELAGELRELVIDTVSRHGGHLGANLGTVELTIALHRVFEIPEDRLLFDVGHQAYVHKILTGRAGEFAASLRQFGGCSGFPAGWESRFDVGAAGHAGTAISTALGISAVMMREGSSRRAIAVVGDGSLNNGISLEGLNNARRDGRNLIVVLNDNKMSISENVGGLANCLNRIISGGFYNRTKAAAKRLLLSLPRHEKIHRVIRRFEDVLKSLILPGVVFEELGFRYIGPINGHSLPDLLRTFERVKGFEGPVLVHVLTEKGRGCEFARLEPERYHGVSGFDRESGEIPVNNGPTFSKAFGAAMLKLAAAHREVTAVSAAMLGGTGLNGFADAHPGRCYDVGIAEEHAVAFSAGLAAAGMRPVCAVYATFMQRALDCVYHDVVLPRFPVIFALDRAGAVEDGPTHHGIYDLGFLRAMPGLTVMAPRNERELDAMLEFAYVLASPVVIRYPRGGSGDDSACPVPPLEPGRAEVVVDGDGPVLWAMGAETGTALAVAALLRQRCGVDCTVINARFLAPFDAELARRRAQGRLSVSMEDHVLSGGLATALSEALEDTPHGGMLHFGWPADQVIPHGGVADLRRAFGLTPEAIAAKIADRLSAPREHTT